MKRKYIDTIFSNPTHRHWAGILFFALLLVACKKGNNENSQPITFHALEHLNGCSINIVDNEHVDRYLVINSQEELNQYIIMNDEDHSACVEAGKELRVDFTESTILIGKKRLNYIEGELIKQSVHHFNEKIVYKVSIKNGGYTAIGQFRFGVVIPKISNPSSVEFDVVVE